MGVSCETSLKVSGDRCAGSRGLAQSVAGKRETWISPGASRGTSPQGDDGGPLARDISEFWEGRAATSADVSGGALTLTRWLCRL